MELLENGQRLPVVAFCLVWLFHVQVPVADAVEAMSMQNRIFECLRHDERLAKPCFRMGVVAPCPQKTQVNCALPFCRAIIHLASRVQCLGVIMLCLIKLAQRFISLPTRTVQRGCRREGQLISSLQGPGEIVDGGTVRVQP